jgi:hypothetical protein
MSDRVPGPSTTGTGTWTTSGTTIGTGGPAAGGEAADLDDTPANDESTSPPRRAPAATATLVEIVDKSKVRLTITMDDEKGKQVANNTATVEAGDYVIFVHALANNDGHLLSLTCN